MHCLRARLMWFWWNLSILLSVMCKIIQLWVGKASGLGGRLWLRAVKASFLASRLLDFLLLWLHCSCALSARLMWFWLHLSILLSVMCTIILSWVDKASGLRSFSCELTKLQDLGEDCGWGLWKLHFWLQDCLISVALIAFFYRTVCEIDAILIAFEHSSVCDVQDHSVVSWQSFRTWVKAVVEGCENFISGFKIAWFLLLWLHCSYVLSAR